MKQEMDYGRFIKDEEFLQDLKSGGRLSLLYDYLVSEENFENGVEKYNLTIRDDRITLYDSGRKLDICKENQYESYVISFNFNNADELLKKSEEELDQIVETLSDLKFGFVPNNYKKQRKENILEVYNKWKSWRKKYIVIKDKTQKNKYAKEHKIEELGFKNRQFHVAFVIPYKDMKHYDFKTLFNELHPIFKSYNRAEEQYRQNCISFLNDFSKDIIAIDVEYKPSFKNSEISKKELQKKYCKGDSSQFVKPDLVCLQKKGNSFLPIFIELKVNCEASIGQNANLLNHLEDNDNYKNLYRNSERERESFQNYVEQTVKNKLEHGLLKINGKKASVSEIEDVLSRIIYDAPELFIVCSLSGKEKTHQTRSYLRKRMNEKFGEKIRKFSNEIIVMEEDNFLENMDWINRKGDTISTFLDSKN